mgnify:CR=1 FL=1
MNKQQIYDYLNNKNIPFEKLEHQPVYNMEQLTEIDMPHKEYEAKNLFLRDDKRKNYYLVTIKGDKKIDLKEVRKKYQTRPLTFASEEELFSILQLKKGAVTPLGLLNDKERKVHFLLDETFTPTSLIGIHPNDNTATIWLKVNDVLSIIKEHGNQIDIVSI